MFRKQFANVISKTGMIPVKDLRPYLLNKDPSVISELDLTELSFFDDIKFAKQISDNYKLVYLELSKAKIRPATLKLINRADVIKYRCIPIQKTAKSVTVAIFDPSIVQDKANIQALFQHSVDFIITNINSWKSLFEKIEVTVDELLHTIREVKVDDSKQEHVKEDEIGDDVILYVNRILAQAYIDKVSDIHIEPYEKKFRIRYRLDGTLMLIAEPNMKLMLPIISRLKILAQMDISEKRKPQDGRIKLMIGDSAIDYRVSSLPTLFGEKIVLRLLDQSNLQLDMTKLGFESKQLNILQKGIQQPYGMCLVTGPTGSGKTTTLYSALADLNKIGKNVSTAEDPVEFNLEGINQVNIKREIGLDYSVALKSFLRQDPDIIMVGEIRDYEVGEVAVEAALTGHLVLSTLHTNDAPSTITRLLNMGIEPFLLTGALNVIVAQRLCRRICESCKTIDKTVSVDDLVACGISKSSAAKVVVYKGRGCPHCNETGYKGRVAIHEVMNITTAIKEAILTNPSSDELKLIAVKEGMKTLRMSALTKVAQGITTIDEAVTNSSSDK